MGKLYQKDPVALRRNIFFIQAGLGFGLPTLSIQKSDFLHNKDNNFGGVNFDLNFVKKRLIVIRTGCPNTVTTSQLSSQLGAGRVCRCSIGRMSTYD